MMSEFEISEPHRSQFSCKSRRDSLRETLNQDQSHQDSSPRTSTERPDPTSQTPALTSPTQHKDKSKALTSRLSVLLTSAIEETQALYKCAYSQKD